MKTKFFQTLIWVFALAVSMTSCGNDDEPAIIDPYAPITEGGVFLPVLVSKPDMEKVKEVEASRKGVFTSKKTVKDDYEEVEEDQYTFKYTDMDFSEVIYCVNTKKGLLTKVIMNHKENESTVDKLKNLAKRNGFSDNHQLSELNNGLVKEKENLFEFSVRNYFDDDRIIFSQYGKQPKAMPTIKSFQKEMQLMLKKKEYKHDQIMAKESELGGKVEEEGKEKTGDHIGKVRILGFRVPQKYEPLKLRYYYFDWKKTPQLICLEHVMRLYTYTTLLN